MLIGTIDGKAGFKLVDLVFNVTSFVVPAPNLLRKQVFHVGNDNFILAYILKVDGELVTGGRYFLGLSDNDKPSGPFSFRKWHGQL